MPPFFQFHRGKKYKEQSIVLVSCMIVLCYFCSLGLVGYLSFKSYQQTSFSFHLLFSLIYLITFYTGFPLSYIMAFCFEYQLPDVFSQCKVFIATGSAYGIYYIAYSSFHRCSSPPIVVFAKNQEKLTACLLALVAVVAFSYFLYSNGFLLFKLEKYSQLFSKEIVAMAYLKRFFYFLLPALLIYSFIHQTKKSWWLLLIIGGVFGIFTYITVGGTRANLALAVAFFFLIGLYQGYLSLSLIVIAGVACVIAMFFLALARYKLNISGSEVIYTFLYLSRDTFSPWENLAHLLGKEFEPQGLMPIIRDFYVYIPQSVWQERPDITWNTANYFTKVILGNQSGLAISPTLLGSLYIMGGFSLIAIGMAFIGVTIKGLDNLFVYGRKQNSALIQAYCFGNLFNLIVLVREGVDAFISRFAFFSLIFLMCWGGAKLMLWRKRDDR